MELVLFVIFGGYLLARVLADKGASKCAKSEFEWQCGEKEKDYNQWLQRVTDKETEFELQDFIYDNVKPVSKKKADADTVGWMSEELKSRLSDVPRDVLEYCTNQEDILLILMAKLGKLPWKVAEWGIDCIGDNCTTPGRRWFVRQLTFIKWLDSELQNHGIEPMLFKKCNEPLKKTDFAQERTTSHLGKYCWWSGRQYV